MVRFACSVTPDLPYASRWLRCADERSQPSPPPRDELDTPKGMQPTAHPRDWRWHGGGSAAWRLGFGVQAGNLLDERRLLSAVVLPRVHPDYRRRFLDRVESEAMLSFSTTLPRNIALACALALPLAAPSIARAD